MKGRTFGLGTQADAFTVNLHVAVKGTSGSLIVRVSAWDISDCVLGFWATEQGRDFRTHPSVARTLGASRELSHHQ